MIVLSDKVATPEVLVMAPFMTQLNANILCVSLPQLTRAREAISGTVA